MSTAVRLMLQFIAMAVILAASACSTAPPPSPKLMERCAKLYGM
jgi:hypothetical protein